MTWVSYTLLFMQFLAAVPALKALDYTAKAARMEEPAARLSNPEEVLQSVLAAMREQSKLNQKAVGLMAVAVLIQILTTAVTLLSANATFWTVSVESP